METIGREVVDSLGVGSRQPAGSGYPATIASSRGINSGSASKVSVPPIGPRTTQDSASTARAKAHVMMVDALRVVKSLTTRD